MRKFLQSVLVVGCASGFLVGRPPVFHSTLGSSKALPPKLHSTLQESPVQNEVESSGFPGDNDRKDEEKLLWMLLCEDAEVKPEGLLRLEESASDVRGVYLNRHVKANDIVLSIPLDKCLRDDKPPAWMPVQDEAQDEDPYFGSGSAWATRLAAGLIEQQTSGDSMTDRRHVKSWHSLLPDSNLLRASLPIHWDEEVVRSARCTALEVAVDTAFFARASSVQDIEMALPDKLRPMIDRRSIDDALDVVQTRTCRVETQDGTALRLLAPAFDFLNHDSDANCGFEREGDSLVVRALVDLPVDEEVTIHYGASSTRPPWKCLTNYGFVPCPQGSENDEPLAEVYLNGVRYEVGSSFIPEDIVAAALQSSIVDVDDGKEGFIPSGQEVELTPEIAERLAHRLSEVAYYHLLDAPHVPRQEFHEDDDEFDYDDETAETILSAQLAASLRWNQHRILLACSQGLQEWADQQASYQ